MRILLSLLFLLIIFKNTQAQDNPIFTDRPNLTDAIATITKGTFQIEAGFQNVRTTFNGGAENNFNTIPNLSFKYGITDKIEFRVLTNYATNNLKSVDADDKSSGLTAITFSPKFALIEQNGWIPKASLVTSLTLPNIGAEDFRNNDLNGGFRFLIDYTLNKFNWTNTVSHDWQDDDLTLWGYTSVIGYAITKKLSAFGELFGYEYSNSLSTKHVDFGVSYLLSNTLVVDCIYGTMIATNDDSVDSERLIGFGIAWKTGGQ